MGQLLLCYDIIIVFSAFFLLARAINHGGLALENPLLFFFVGTAVFINVGSVRDKMLFGSSPPPEDFFLHNLELLHLLLLVAGFYSVAAIHPRQVDTAGGAETVSGKRLLALIACALAIKLRYFNVFQSTYYYQSNYFSQLELFPIAVAVVAAAWAHQHWDNRTYGAIGRALRYLVLSSACLLLGFTFSRTPLMYVLFVCIMLIYYDSTKAAGVRRGASTLRRAYVLLLPLGLFLIIVIGSAVKGYNQAVQTGGGLGVVREVERHQVRTLGFIDAYESALFTLRYYPDVVPFRWFDSLTSILAGPIPRSLWPGKPYGFSYWLTLEKEGLNAQESGFSLSTSLMGDFWASGGLVSLVALSLLLGAVMGIVYKRHRLRGQPGLGAVLYWEFCFMILIAPRGDAYIIFSRGLIIMAITWFVGRLATTWLTPGQTKRTRTNGFLVRHTAI